MRCLKLILMTVMWLLIGQGQTVMNMMVKAESCRFTASVQPFLFECIIRRTDWTFVFTQCEQ